MRTNLLAGVLLTLPLLARAEGWSGEVSIGYLSTSGNTSTSSGSAKVAADYVAQQWKNAIAASAINTEDQGQTSAERYTVGDKLDWNFSERNYVFGAVEYEKDLFGGIRERISETAGYGRHVLIGPDHLLDLEIGAGARQTEVQGTGAEERDAIGRAYGKYQWKISATSTFAQALKVESGKSNTFTESVTELKLSVIGNLFATLSYTVKNNSDVPAGSERTDTASAVSLTYQFGKK